MTGRAVAGTVALAFVLSSNGAGRSNAQDAVLELTNTSSADASYVRITDDPGLEPQTFTVEAWITPKGPGDGSGDSAGNTVVGGIFRGSITVGTIPLASAGG